MIKYLKKLWNKCFGSVGYSRIKEVKPIPQPTPLHCAKHSRFKKSCAACMEIIS